MTLVNYCSNIPLTKNNGDAAFDLRSITDCIIQPWSRSLIPTGLRLSMPTNIYAQIHPRSGLALRGIDVGAGVIDSSYRDQIKVVLINNSDGPFHVSVGDRIAQLIFHPLAIVELHLVDQLDNTERGLRGFGSSGIQ